MKSFQIENKLIVESSTENRLRWPAPIIFLGFFFIMYFAYSEVNYVALIFGVVYTARLFIKSSEGSFSHSFGFTTLEFGQSNLLYKNKESIIWHIPYKRLEKIQCVCHGSGTVLSPTVREVLVLTSDNDSYSIMGHVSDEQIKEIQNEIEYAKSKSI